MKAVPTHAGPYGLPTCPACDGPAVVASYRLDYPTGHRWLFSIRCAAWEVREGWNADMPSCRWSEYLGEYEPT